MRAFERRKNAFVPCQLAEGRKRVAVAALRVVDAAVVAEDDFGAVVGRFLVVTVARYLVRTAGIRVSFDLRQALFNALQLQGGSFFNRYTIGDMMTRPDLPLAHDSDAATVIDVERVARRACLDREGCPAVVDVVGGADDLAAFTATTGGS